MVIPKVRDETSVNAREGSRQAVKNYAIAGERIKQALGNREVSWLSRETGYGDSTIRDALRRGPARTDVALAIAKALDVSVDWLFSGRKSAAHPRLLADADKADWVEVPEYALHEIDELGKMDPISTTLMRRDWLYTSLGDASDLWIARLPARYDALTLGTGTPLFCKDHRQGERMSEGTYYLFRINGGIVMAPFTYRDSGAGDDAVHSRDIGVEDDRYQPVARVVGQLARPI